LAIVSNSSDHREIIFQVRRENSSEAMGLKTRMLRGRMNVKNILDIPKDWGL